MESTVENLRSENSKNCPLVDNDKILESWLEGTTGFFLGRYKIKKIAKNDDVVIFGTFDSQLNKNSCFVYFYQTNKLQVVETFEGAMHLYFY